MERLKTREEPARDARRAADPDRNGVRGHSRGRHRAAQVVGPLPRQAEDRDVHAPDQASAGRHDPDQMRVDRGAVARARTRAGRLSTRQNVQLHFLELASLPDVFARLEEAGLTTIAGACGDAVRNVTGCPVAGLAHDELFDVAPARRDRRVLLWQPRLHRPSRYARSSISACARLAATRPRSTASRSSASSVRRARVRRAGRWQPLVGPRVARDLGVFVRVGDEAMPVLRAILDAWREDLRYRISRVKARMKFMVDDYGPEGARRGRGAPRLRARLPRCPRSTASRRTTSASGPRSRTGSCRSGFPSISAWSPASSSCKRPISPQSRSAASFASPASRTSFS